jgi:hypothetical protein
MISRSIYNLKIDTISTYHTLFDSLFLQLSNGIRHVVPSTDRRLKLKAKNIDGSDRPAAGCVCEWIWLAGRLRDGCVCQWVNMEVSRGVSGLGVINLTSQCKQNNVVQKNVFLILVLCKGYV